MAPFFPSTVLNKIECDNGLQKPHFSLSSVRMKFTSKEKKCLEESLQAFSSDDSLGFSGIHGLLSALACGPLDLSRDEKHQLVLYGEIDASRKLPELPELFEKLTELDSEITESFLLGETMLLPCSLELENGEVSDSLNDWVLGFFEGHFLDEDKWYEKDEKMAAEMLLPLLVSFDEIDDPDLSKIREDMVLFQRLVQEIPHALQDLYLFYSS
jgi:uncharacterized protein